MKKIALVSAILFALPFSTAYAQNLNFGFFSNALVRIGELLNLTIPILIGVALIVFFWGLIQYIRKPEAETGKKIMIAGLVGLFIMVSVWGIIRLMQNITNTQDPRSIPAPRVPTSGPPANADWD